MVIPRKVIDAQTRALRGLSEAAKKHLARLLAEIEWTDIADLREQVIAVMEEVCGAAADTAAGISAAAYDMVRDIAGAELAYVAVAEHDRKPEATAGAVRALVGKVEGRDTAGFFEAMLQRVSYEIRRSAGENAIINAQRDPAKPRFARVPTGAETCDFCIMLASRGAVYRSAMSAGEMNHYHANCDCRIVPVFRGQKVEGYDPSEWRRIYEDGKLKREAEKNQAN